MPGRKKKKLLQGENRNYMESEYLYSQMLNEILRTVKTEHNVFTIN